MTSKDVLNLYQQGHSIDYIVNKFYYSQKAQNKIINAQMRRIILIENRLKKNEVRGEVYKIIYANLKNDRTI